MARRLRNITITVEEDVARWARIEAAKQDTSVSRLLGQALKRLMQQAEEVTRQNDDYEKAMRRALSRKPFFKSGGQRYLTREEAHDRGHLR